MNKKNKSKLNIVSVETNIKRASSENRQSKMNKVKFFFESEWAQNPDQFDPNRNIREKERLSRSWATLTKTVKIKDAKITDLGCGSGDFTKKLRNAGGKVDAIDIATTPLEKLKDEPNIHPMHDALPLTKLADNIYDIVVSLDVIANLNPIDFRLYFSELARLLKRDGHVLCSSAIDYKSEDSLEQFSDLAQTEFKIDKWTFSYHRLLISLLNFFKSPKRFSRAQNDKKYRKRQIQKRKGLSRLWFHINSTLPLVYFWTLIKFLSKPIVNVLEQNRYVMRTCERISQFIWDESAISHAIFIGQLKPIMEETAQEKPKVRKGKKQVWE